MRGPHLEIGEIADERLVAFGHAGLLPLLRQPQLRPAIQDALLHLRGIDVAEKVLRGHVRHAHFFLVALVGFVRLAAIWPAVIQPCSGGY